MKRRQAGKTKSHEMAVVVPHELRDQALYVFKNDLAADPRFWEIILYVGLGAMARAKRQLDEEMIENTGLNGESDICEPMTGLEPSELLSNPNFGRLFEEIASGN